VTLHLPAYRVTVYVASLVQTDSTVLTPTSAAHSDDFKVTTLPSLAGWKPYLMGVGGRHGEIDPLTKRWSMGQMTVRILDYTLTDNLTRWVTAFIGDATGANPLLNCKVYIEESLDGGTVWAAYFVGRIDDMVLASANEYELVVKDFSSDLNIPCFVGRPRSTVSYAILPQLLPVGLAADYGDVNGSDPLPATIEAPNTWMRGEARTLLLDPQRTFRPDNELSDGWVDYLTAPPQSPVAGDFYTSTVRPGLRLRFTGGSIADKECKVTGVRWRMLVYSRKIYEIGVEPLDATDQYYTSITTGTIANGTDITFRIYALDLPPVETTGPSVSGLLAARPTKAPVVTSNAPLILSGVNPATLVADLLDGKFGDLNLDGTAKRTFEYDSASIAALVSPSGARRALPSANFVVTEQQNILDVIERWVCVPYGLAYRLEPYANGGNPISRFVLCDMRLATATDYGVLPEITDDDLTTDPIEWNHKKTDAATVVRVTGYVDDVLDGLEMLEANHDNERAPPIVSSYPVVFLGDITADVGRPALGVKYLDIDAPGLRRPVKSYTTEDATTVEEWLAARAQTVRWHYLPMVGWGVMEVGITCRRTTNVQSLWPGEWVSVEVDMLPDPATKVRGGARLMCITGRQEDGVQIKFSLIDAGPVTSAGVPTVGALATGSVNGKHYIEVPITRNANSDPVVIEYAITGQGASRYVEPDSDSTLWHQSQTATANGTYTVGPFPSNATVFFRARSEPASRLRLPSEWAFPSGNNYYDTSAYTAPSSLGISPSTALSGTNTYTLSWTNGDATLPVALRIENTRLMTTFDGLPSTFHMVLPPGSTQLVINPWITTPAPAATTLGRVHVAHIDPFGGNISATLNFSVADSFTGPTLAAPTLAISGTSSTTGATGYNAAQRRPRATGVRLTVTGGLAGSEILIEQDTDVAFGSSDTARTVPGWAAAIGALNIEIDIPLDGQTWYFRARQSQPGYVTSAWSSSVNAVPRILR
jgi:hypothetical protein